jgi:hypothetical protein
MLAPVSGIIHGARNERARRRTATLESIAGIWHNRQRALNPRRKAKGKRKKAKMFLLGAAEF